MGRKQMGGGYDKGPDHYAQRAKKEGYPARSVYKLEEIQVKLRVMRHGDHVLDIGAAPGSWTLYASRQTSPGGRIVAVDVARLAIPNLPRNIAFLQGDAFSPELLGKLEPLAHFNVILSDAAPSTTGNRTVDAGRSFQIASGVLDLAVSYLSPGGNLVVKIFQGGDEGALLARMRELFESARMLKPRASRSISFETYGIGIGKRPSGGEF